eukprot:6458366-Amphidinium_carterae.1
MNVQPIIQAELYAGIVAKATWHERLKHRKVNCFIDNMGAKIIMSKGSAKDDDIKDILLTGIVEDVWAQGGQRKGNPPSNCGRGSGGADTLVRRLSSEVGRASERAVPF